MAIRSTEWHEECLINFNVSLTEYKKQLKYIESKIEQMEKESKFMALQIETAKAQNRKGFDGGRFMVKRGKP